MIQEKILKLVNYGLATGLVEKEHTIFTTNRLLELFQVDDIDDEVLQAWQAAPTPCREEAEGYLEELLGELLDYAYENGITTENSVVYRDLFDTKIMSMLMPRPSQVIKTFRDLYEKESPVAATDY